MNKLQEKESYDNQNFEDIKHRSEERRVGKECL